MGLAIAQAATVSILLAGALALALIDLRRALECNQPCLPGDEPETTS